MMARRVMAASRRLWTPREMATALWLDAADVSTITKNGANLVSQWGDKSGRFINVAQSNDTKKPLYGATSLNGINVMTADGSDDEFRLTCPIPGTGSFTIATVSQTFGGLGGKSIIGGGADSTTGFYAHHYHFQPQGGNKWISAWGSANGASFSNQDFDTKWHISISVYDQQTNKQYVGGVMGTVGVKLNSNLSELSNSWGVFSAGAIAGNNCAGSIAEIVVIANAASDVVRRRLEGYLAHKWGLATTLSADHPYKSRPPRV